MAGERLRCAAGLAPFFLHRLCINSLDEHLVCNGRLSFLFFFCSLKSARVVNGRLTLPRAVLCRVQCAVALVEDRLAEKCVGNAVVNSCGATPKGI